MTREEAIAYGEDYLKDLITACCHIEEKHKEFVRMAIAALKAEPCEDAISRKHLLSGIDELMQSPWFNRWKDDGGALHFGYTERKEAVEIVRDLCVKAVPPVTPKSTECEDAVSREAVLDLFETIMTKSEIYRAVIKLPPVTPKQRWIPEGATNGDVIKTMFPNAKITEYGDCLVDFTYQTESQFFTLDWWNAPYKREGDAE